MTLRAYAKINIGLHILGKRSDGYHDLETIFHEIDCFDEITLEQHNKLEMTADSILVPVDETNLCLQAAQALQKKLKIKNGAMIHLKKNIPIGAGLGGGSSDAAAVLRGLNKFWELDLSNEKLRAVAEKIGSDVPYFIEGGDTYATGRGEILESISLRLPFWIAVVTPLINISTAWAYKHLKLQRDGRPTELQTNLLKNISKPQKLASLIQNDFEKSTFGVYPEIDSIKDIMKDTGAVFTLMSGSGSSVFAFFENEKKARELISSFPDNYQSSVTAPSFKPDHKVID